MNSSGLKPDLSSHSGTYPASGAVRSGGSAVDLRFTEKGAVLDMGAKAAAVAITDAAVISFIVSTKYMERLLFFQCM